MTGGHGGKPDCQTTNTDLDEVENCFCCRATRHGQHLLQHSFDKHQRQVPLAIRVERPEDVHHAANVLREHGFDVTFPLPDQEAWPVSEADDEPAPLTYRADATRIIQTSANVCIKALRAIGLQVTSWVAIAEIKGQPPLIVGDQGAMKRLPPILRPAIRIRQQFAPDRTDSGGGGGVSRRRILMALTGGGAIVGGGLWAGLVRPKRLKPRSLHPVQPGTDLP